MRIGMKDLLDQLRRRNAALTEENERLKLENRAYYEKIFSLRSMINLARFAAKHALEDYDNAYIGTDKYDGEIHNKFTILWGEMHILYKACCDAINLPPDKKDDAMAGWIDNYRDIEARKKERKKQSVRYDEGEIVYTFVSTNLLTKFIEKVQKYLIDAKNRDYDVEPDAVIYLRDNQAVLENVRWQGTISDVYAIFSDVCRGGSTPEEAFEPSSNNSPSKNIDGSPKKITISNVDDLAYNRYVELMAQYRKDLKISKRIIPETGMPVIDVEGITERGNVRQAIDRYLEAVSSVHKTDAPEQSKEEKESSSNTPSSLTMNIPSSLTFPFSTKVKDRSDTDAITNKIVDFLTEVNRMAYDKGEELEVTTNNGYVQISGIKTLEILNGLLELYNSISKDDAE